MSQVASEATGPALEQNVSAETADEIGNTPWQLFWFRFKQDRAAFVGLGFLFFLVVLALLAPLISAVVGHGPNELFKREMTDSFGLPYGPDFSQKFFFGADLNGRDLFVRVIYGIQTSLKVALAATACSVVIGVSLGIMAGYFRGVADTIISRAIDIVLSMPYLLFALGISAACSTTVEGCELPLGIAIKPGLPLVIFIIAVFTWPFIARIVRGNTLSLREKEFIEASRSLGASNARVMVKEILPNLVAPIIVYATLIIPANIIFESALSFLGLGVPQGTPSWGRMLADAARVFDVAWWMMLFPGLFLFLTTLSFNILGDGLRDALDPRTGR